MLHEPGLRVGVVPQLARARLGCGHIGASRGRVRSVIAVDVLIGERVLRGRIQGGCQHDRLFGEPGFRLVRAIAGNGPLVGRGLPEGFLRRRGRIGCVRGGRDFRPGSNADRLLGEGSVLVERRVREHRGVVGDGRLRRAGLRERSPGHRGLTQRVIRACGLLRPLRGRDLGVGLGLGRPRGGCVPDGRLHARRRRVEGFRDRLVRGRPRGGGLGAGRGDRRPGRRGLLMSGGGLCEARSRCGGGLDGARRGTGRGARAARSDQPSEQPCAQGRDGHHDRDLPPHDPESVQHQSVSIQLSRCPRTR